MKSTSRPANEPRTRPGHASANASPVSSVRMSIHRGGSPNLIGDAWAGEVGLCNLGHRRTERPKRVHDPRRVVGGGINPDVEVARRPRFAMQAQGVQRPRTRNRTSAATNARNKSRKSWFIGRRRRGLPLLLAETPRPRGRVRPPVSASGTPHRSGRPRLPTKNGGPSRARGGPPRCCDPCAHYLPTRGDPTPVPAMRPGVTPGLRVRRRAGRPVRHAAPPPPPPNDG